MGALTAPHLLALDGGNSKTDVLLVTEDGTVVARARSGPFAPHMVGVTTAVAALAPAVAEVMRTAQINRVAVVAAYLANADLPVEEAAIAQTIEGYGWADHVVVRNDTFAMLRTGTDSPFGVAVVCGAGINCVGIGRDGRHVRYPALGRISGDWGGGYAIGKEALWHATRAEDGRGPSTILSTLVARYFDRACAVDVATGMHLQTIDRDRMHEIVPIVFSALDAGDDVAASIVRQQAAEIVLLATNTVRRLDAFDDAIDVILGGGMLTSRHPALLDTVLAGIRECAPLASIMVVDADPIVGSALLGLDQLDALTGRLGSSPERRDRLQVSLENRQEIHT